jgi:release factor glutamine methyltransferase
MTVSEWLGFAATKVARSEARQVLESIIGLSREELLAAGQRELSQSEVTEANQRLERQLCGEPLAYVVGRKEFYGREYVVSNSVLIPRPETELLVEAVLSIMRPGWTCIDVGTGSGCIAVTLAIEANGKWIATDTSPIALRVAKQNANHLGAEVRFLQADLLATFQDHSFDVIVSNPPYIANEDPRVDRSVDTWEPHAALYAGPTGLEALSKLIDQAERVLKPKGSLAFEFGAGQAQQIDNLMKNWQVSINRDLAGIERYALAQLAQ